MTLKISIYEIIDNFYSKDGQLLNYRDCFIGNNRHSVLFID